MSKSYAVHCGIQEMDVVVDDILRHGGTPTGYEERGELEGNIIYCDMTEAKMAVFIDDVIEEGITVEEFDE